MLTYVYTCVPVWVCARMWRYTWKLEGMGFPGAEVADGRESPDMAAGS